MPHPDKQRVSIFFSRNATVAREPACKATTPPCEIIPEPRPEKSIYQRESPKVKVLRRASD